MTEPFSLFKEWYNAIHSRSSVMTLATCSKSGIPSARIVLLKQYNEGEFVFFTNINSRKGKELKENPYAALVFYWEESSQQIRVEGKVKLLDTQKIDQYHSSRSRESQISAWCSKQSSVLESWQNFEQDIILKDKEFYNQQIPRPDFWVGFCLVPQAIEFWREGKHRRHLRLRYTLTEKDKWKVEQLYP
ncbi:MAG: pyridoxamine 5'-phosphate oxidase [Wolbachia endosymbiont of Fragariocoptes setiger]|nr:pyridoxamine 5'-phosphate oxidase [Wolbachia endosymbiont of Fragariocoptes setiger]